MKELDRRPVEEPRLAYRFVDVSDVDDAALPSEFRSDFENGAIPRFKREKRYPELFDGMSMYGSPEAAIVHWEHCWRTAQKYGEEMRLGAHIAEVCLQPGQGFEIEDLEQDDEHLTIWGDPDQLAAAVRRIFTPEPPGE